jgi:hypothetical protein
VTLPRKALVLAAALAALCFGAPAHAALWVSASGDDRNPGTEEKPVRTLAHARDLVRGLNRAMTDDITVFISGVHRITEPIAFGPADSGTHGFSIVYSAAPGEHPVVSGAVRVTGWKLEDPKGTLWSAPVPGPPPPALGLFVNGVPARRTHVRLQQPDPHSDGSPILPANPKNPQLVAFVGIGPIALWSDRVGMMPFFADNLFEGLGRPGEWYFDPAARRLYYTPRPGEYLASADVEAAVTPQLIDGTGTPEHPLTGIVFKGIRFECTTDTSDAQSEGAAAVRFQGAAYVQFLEDAFVHLGTAGIRLGPSFQEGEVEGCLFGDITWSALTADDAQQVHVTSSRFSYVATHPYAAAAVEVLRSRDISVDFCQLDHFAQQAIRVSGSGPIHDEMNRAAVPVLERDRRRPAGNGAGVPRAFEGLLDEQLWAPAPPLPPLNVAVDPEDSSANVAWDPSCYDGGSEVSAFTVVASSGAKISVSAQAFRAKGYVAFPGLENGQELTFTVSAVNDLGPGSPSLPSAPVVPDYHRRAKAPKAPGAVKFLNEDGRVLISLSPSSTKGGSPVLFYTLTIPTLPEPLVIEGRDVLHDGWPLEITRDVSGHATPPGTTASVTATSASGESKPATFKWP